jgi:hypothetical protein
VLLQACLKVDAAAEAKKAVLRNHRRLAELEQLQTQMKSAVDCRLPQQFATELDSTYFAFFEQRQCKQQLNPWYRDEGNALSGNPKIDLKLYLRMPVKQDFTRPL